MLQKSLRGLFTRTHRPSHKERRPGGRRRFAYRPWLEALEELVMPDAVRWINPAGGDWGVAANWDAGHVPGPGDDATIDLSGITVTHSTGTDSVNSLLVTGATFSLSGGALQTGVVQLQGAGTLFKLSGGTLQNATVSETPDAQMIGTTAGGTLDGVTLNGNLDLTQTSNVVAGVRDGLLLNGAILVGNAAGNAYGVLDFLNNETIDGTGGGGSIQLGGSASNRLYLFDASAAVAVTFGPNLTVHGASGGLVSYYNRAGSGFSNQGTISADTPGGTIGLNFGTSGGGNGGTLAAQGGTLNVSGTWANSGTLLAAGGILSLGGTWSTTVNPSPVDGTLTLGGTLDNSNGQLALTADSGGTVNLAGTLNNTNGSLTLAGNGTFRLANGTLLNGTVGETSPAVLAATTAGGVLDGVTLNGNLDLTQANNVNAGLRDGLLLNGSILVGNAAGTAYGVLDFLNNETIDGTGGGGSIQLGGSASNRLYLFDASAAVAVTLGPNLNVHGVSGSVVSYYNHAGSSFSNQGTISADTAGGTIGLNFGSGGGSGGTLEAQGGTLNVSGTWSNSGTLLAASGILSLGGTWSTSVNPSPVDGTLTFAGTLDNSNGQLTLTADSGGTVNLAGTLNSTNGSLTLTGGGAFNLVGGTLLNGTVSGALTGTPAGGTLDGVMLNGTLDLSQTSSTAASLRDAFLLNGTVLVGNAAGSTYGTLYFLNSETVDGTGGGGSIQLGGSASNRLLLYDASAAVAVTLGLNLTIHGKNGGVGSYQGRAGSGFSNRGTISADTPGGTIGLNFGTSGGGNGGTLAAQGGTLNVSGTWSNSGTLLAAGGILSLGGTWSTSVNPSPVDGTLTFAGTLDNSNGQLTLTADSGGTVNLAGTLNSTNGSLTLTGGGAFNLVGGTLLNGTVSGVLTGTTAGGALDGVTLNGTLDLTQASNVGASLRNGFLLNGVILVGNAAGTTYGTLYFLNSETIDGTGSGGSVLLEGSGSNRLLLYDQSAAVAVTFGPNFTVHGKSGSLGSYQGRAGSGFSNQGTISADTPGGTIGLNFGSSGGNGGTLEAQGGTLSVSGTWSNSGTLVAASGTLVLASPYDNSNGQLTITANAGGAVSFTSTFTNTNGSLTLTGAGTFYLAGGSIIGGTVTETGVSLVAINSANNTLNGVTLDGNLDLASINNAIVHLVNGLTLNGTLSVGNSGGSTYGTVYLNGTQTIGGSGSIVFGGSGNNAIYLLGSGLTETFGPNLTIHGKTGLIAAYGSSTGSFVNQGTINVDTAGGTINLGFGANGSNSGTLEAQGGTLSVSGTWSNSGSVQAQGSTVSLAGVLSGTGSFNAGTGGTLAFTATSVSLAGASVVSGVGTVSFASTVTTAGTYNVAGTTRVTAGTLTFGAGSRVLTSGALVVSGGTVHFDSGAPARTATLTLSGGTLTGADTLTVTGLITWTGGTMSGTGMTVAQGGLTLSGSNDLTLDQRALTNAGRAADTQAGRVVANNGAQITNQAGAVWDFQGNGTIAQGSGIAGGFTNAGTLQKSAGTGTTTIGLVFNNTGTVNVNAGTIALSTVVQRTGSSLTGGTWSVGAGATLSLGGLITDSAANITLDGATAAFPALNTLANNTGSFTILDGRNFSSPGDFTNAGKLTVGAGSMLTVSGNYTQTAAGSYTLQIGSDPTGNQVGHTRVSGMAMLSGTLNVQFVNGYGPRMGNTYQALTYASETGDFGTLNGAAFGRFPLFQKNVTATSVDLVTIVDAPDLATDTIMVPATGIPGQNTTITYTVKNLSTSTAQGPWYDSVYLTAATTLDANALLIGRVNHMKDVAGGDSYTETLTAPVPGALPGTYHVIVVADSRGLVPDINRVNNTLTAMGTISLSMPMLNLGDSAMGTIANGQDVYYQLNVPVGHDVQVAASFGAANAAELYVRYKGVPSPATYDQFAFAVGQMQEQVLVPSPQGGTYYILLHGREGAASGTTFRLMTIDLPFGVRAVSPDHGGNIGFTTFTVTGTKFTPATQVSLVAPNGTRYPALSVLFKDSDTLFATVDLTGASLGAYDVRVDDQGQTAIDSGAFTVRAGGGGNVVYNMSAPNYVRNGMLGTVTVTYENIGTTDALAPLLTLVATNGVIRLPDQANFAGSTVQFLAINSTGPAGVLPPGVVGHITFTFQASPTAPLGSRISFALGLTTNTEPIDWSSVKSAFRPPFVSTGAWDPIWSNFLASVGSTTGQLQTVLDRDATYLSQLGEYTADVNRLVGFEIEKASDSLPAFSLAQAVDAVSPAPGLTLGFSRQFVQSLAGRYQLGRLGRGWTDNWDISAGTDSHGNVTVLESGSARVFVEQADGSYQSGPGDYGVLSRVGGVYHLREKNGSLLAFRTDGSLDYMQDSVGNRITAGYTGTQLTSLTQSNGESLRLDYNAQGRIRQVTDAAGRATTYTYDDSGEHLLAVAGPLGTTQYTYVSGQGAGREHALASVTFPDNTHQFFDYDAQGRLSGQHRDGDAEAVTYAYGAGGQVMSTDAAQDVTTVLYNEFGQPGQVIDPLGHSVQLQYDSSHNIVLVSAPGGTTYSFSYDARGNLVRQVDPLGNVITQSYDPQFNQVLRSTDARGNTTNYSYDSNGSLLAVTYPDGSKHQFSYDPLGNLIESMNDRNDAIDYRYNANGQLTRKDFADGSHVDYGYDAHGNPVSATDATGTTVLQYDSADRLMRITYPSGRFLQFTYDSGGRRSRSVDQDSFTVNYQYDSVGRLAGLTDGSGARIVTYTYDAAGRLMRKDLGNGTYTTYDYDRAGEILHLTNYAPGGSANSQYDYTYDALGQVSTMSTGGVTTTYRYDADGRLVSVSDTTGLSIQYTYDQAGNRVSQNANGVVTTYVVNNLNQYTSATKAGTGTTMYSYDPDGNLISQLEPGGSTTMYVYNDLNQLVSVSGPGISARYIYDPFGNRTSQTINGMTTDFLIDLSGLTNVVAAYSESGPSVAHYTYGLGLVSQVATGGSAAYYDFDLAGNTIGITNSSGGYVNRYSYLPFGETTASSEGVLNPFAYGGEFGVQKAAGGLDFMRARYYLPSLGRFNSADPISLAVPESNHYAYAGSNPTLASDPTGLWTISIGGGVTGGAAAGGTAQISYVWDGSSLLPQKQLTYGGGVYIGAGASSSVGITYTTAPSAKDLEGSGLQVGGSIGIPPTTPVGPAAGGDLIIGKNYTGFSLNGGVSAGIPVETHGFVTNTVSLGQATPYDLLSLTGIVPPVVIPYRNSYPDL